MQNFGNLAFARYDGIYRFLGAQHYGKEPGQHPHDNENQDRKIEREWMERRIRDRRRNPV